MGKREETFYEILKVSQNVTLKEIKLAYKQRAMEYHPDSHPIENSKFCHEMMCKINKAYSILRNPEERQLYDEVLFEKGKCNSHNEEDDTSQTSNEEPQRKTYKKVIHPNREQYNCYDADDFDEEQQEEFIEWVEWFSYEYIRYTFDYYRKFHGDSSSILEAIYDSFGEIINYEKETLKKTGKSCRL